MKEQLEMFDVGTEGTASATDLAWVAGFIDGEGCITITKKKPHGRQKTGWYALELIVTNTNKETIDRIYGLFKCGGVYQTQGGRAGWKSCFQWRCSDNGARLVVEKLLPYLFTKRAQAETAIGFCDLPRTYAQKHGVPEWLAQKRDEHFVAMRKLNGLSTHGRKKTDRVMESSEMPPMAID